VAQLRDVVVKMVKRQHRWRHCPRLSAPSRALFATLCAVRLAAAEDGDAYTEAGLGLAPGTPQVGTLPGGIVPAYGQKPKDEQDYRFDFHGFFTMPLRVGLNQRAGAVTTEQKTLVI